MHVLIKPSLSRFFRNKGAVAGVFLIVGLAAASIVLFLFFFIRRRRRTRRMEHDNAVASTLAAAGFNRTLLDGDDDDTNPSMAQRQGSALSGYGGSLPSQAGRPHSGYLDDPASTPPAVQGDVDPFAGHVVPPPQAAVGFPSRKDGYMPARTSSPPPGVAPTIVPSAWVGERAHHHSQSTRSTSTSSIPTSAVLYGQGHVPHDSSGSHEPLLSGIYPGEASGPVTPRLPGAILAPSSDVPPPPPKNPKRLIDVESPFGDRTGLDDPITPGSRDERASSVYSTADDDDDDDVVGEPERPALAVSTTP